MKRDYAAITYIKVRQAAFLKDTAEHYNSGNRAMLPDEVNKCCYRPTQTSEGCAIGRHLPPEVSNSLNQQLPVQNQNILCVLPAWMLEMEIEFLQSIQALHDCRSNWDKNGLTETGHLYFNNIVDYFKLADAMQSLQN